MNYKDKCNGDSDQYTITALNTKNELIDVIVSKCKHCDETVPVVGICPDCRTVYEHVKTVENPETGFIHFVYECLLCPPGKRKAQKIIRVTDGNSNANTRDDLIKNFL
ncbi:MAG: hypothetical protein KKB09_07410 [Nanoarchaeota archaeon]|nr:hypothetical protein [Nanoarchaeota archaeon]